MRDHYGRTTPGGDLTPADAQYFSVCMHAEPVGTTTASMITRLSAEENEPLLYWASLASPCASAFVPLFMDGDIPEGLGRGGPEPSEDSVWWHFKHLLTLVERNWAERVAHVRATLDRFEADCAERIQPYCARSTSAAERTVVMAEMVDDLGRRVRQLRGELES